MQTATRIILIEPRDPRNVGMVARAMANFGFSDLALVAPPAWDAEQARVTARNASGIIDAVRICETLPDAAMDTHTLCGFALRDNIPAARQCDLIQLTGHRQAAPDVRFSSSMARKRMTFAMSISTSAAGSCASRRIAHTPALTSPKACW
jgi:tRNA C32,U32 (ribose-2'-O)-methylase TrmJ